MRTIGILVIASAGLFIAGCGPDYWDGDYVIDGYDSGEVVGYEGGLGTMGSEGDMVMGIIPMANTPEQAAQKSADRMKTRFTPAACLNTVVNGSTVEATFNKCAGPHGLVSVTGKVTYVFSSAAGAMLVKVTGTGVSVNRYTLNLDTSVSRTITGNIATLTFTTKGRGNGPHGRELTRDGIYTLTYDVSTECRTIEGNWKTVVEGKTWNTTLTGHKRCGTDCPMNGARLVHEGGISGRTITIYFDGSGNAKWDSSAGKSGTFMPFCGSNI
jgi:hypothetical protein